MPTVNAAQGIHGSGARSFDDDQYRRVVEAIRRGSGTVEQITLATGVPGRTVREIVSAADGVDILLGGDGNGYRLAETREDSERLSSRLESQAQRMYARVARRRGYAVRNFDGFQGALDL